MFIEQKLKNVFKEQEKMQTSKFEKFTKFITGPLDVIRMVCIPSADEDSWDKLRMIVAPILYPWALMFLMGFIGNRLTIYQDSDVFAGQLKEV
jgi:hypothetical protein